MDGDKEVVEGQLDNSNKLKAASSEAESHDQKAAAGATDDTVGTNAGTGRSYECVFCKKGFSTAQALGGHMNIHRRDRARVTKGAGASASARRGAAEDGTEVNYGHYHPYSLPRRSSSSLASPVPVFSEYSSKSQLSQDQCSTNNTTYRSYNSEARSSIEEDPGVVRRPSELSLFGDEELHLELGLHRGGDHGDGKHIKDGADEEEKELDLELRLGRHDPR